MSFFFVFIFLFVVYGHIFLLDSRSENAPANMKQTPQTVYIPPRVALFVRTTVFEECVYVCLCVCPSLLDIFPVGQSQ